MNDETVGADSCIESQGAPAAGIIAVGLTILVISLTGAAANSRISGADLSGEFWRPTCETRTRLQERLKDRLSALPSEPAEYRDLINAYMELHLILQVKPPPEEGEIAPLHRRFLSASQAFIRGEGVDSLVAVGEYLAINVVESLEHIALAISLEQIELVDWLAGHQDDKHLHRLRALGGDFLEKAVAAGLVAPGSPPDADSMLVARLLWLQNWLNVNSVDDRGIFDKREKTLVAAWKAEAAQHLPMARRLEILDALDESDTDYPAMLVKGVLLASEGNLEQARQLFLNCVKLGIYPEQARKRLFQLKNLYLP